MNPATTEPDSGLDGYEVLVGVAGGIAAYKVASVVSALVQRGAGVTVLGALGQVDGNRCGQIGERAPASAPSF